MGDEPPPFYGELTGMALPKKPTKPDPVRHAPATSQRARAAAVTPRGARAQLCLALPVTLSELFNGATKKLSYQRRVLKDDSTTEDTSHTLHVRVVPGWEDGTIVNFPGLGDEGIDCEAADVEVQVQTEPHSPWEREGATLYYTARISLSDALCGTIVEIPTLDGRTLSVPVNQVVAPGVTKTVPGEGMPTASGGRGDLTVLFDVDFPRTLTPEQKATIKKALH